MSLEYVIYADESVERGSFFSNFYGGCLVRSKDLAEVTDTLDERKRELNLLGEVKWQKVTSNYVQKYESLVETFFSLVASGRVKVRVMFTQNRQVPTGLTSKQRENGYFLLYYQFVKHAFGLQYADHGQASVGVRLLLDSLPDSFEKRARFRAYVAALTQSAEFRRNGVEILADHVAEVRSHDHVLLQCSDIVLGAMQFRLNDHHKRKLSGQRIRGKRTRAKERLYHAVYARIRCLRPGFNPGESTGIRGDVANRWRDPYRHWKFLPREFETDASQTKRG